MGDKTVEQRLEAAEGQMLAHSISLRALAVQVFSEAEGREATRDTICEAIERIYAEPGIVTRAHGVLQAALHEVEQIFRVSRETGGDDQLPPQR